MSRSHRPRSLGQAGRQQDVENAGPLGRNAGEVIGVFGILDWQEDKRWFTRLTGSSLSAMVSGQATKKKQIYFKSSIDLFNLERLESHLRTLKSPRWPFCRNKKKEGAYYLPAAPKDKPVDDRPCARGDTKVDARKAKTPITSPAFRKSHLNPVAALVESHCGSTGA